VRGLAIITVIFSVWSSKSDTAWLTSSAYLVGFVDYRWHANHAIRLGTIGRLYVCLLLYLYFSRHGVQYCLSLTSVEHGEDAVGRGATPILLLHHDGKLERDAS
jgi:hypothetical protein